MTDVFLVTKDVYPAIFHAFEVISNDCGRQAGHKNYAVPLEWEPKASEIDLQLMRLMRDDEVGFTIFCIGEENQMKVIANARGMNDANDLLQRFFEEFS